MSDWPRILAFAGSTRKDSFNKKLVPIAAEAARAGGVEVTVIDLKDYPLPLFDEDLEATEGTPPNAAKLKSLLVEHDGLLVASPEYNSSITAVLKNAIDWASRPAKGEPPLVAFRGKVAALMSASPGALGGLRGLVHVRSILGNIGVIVLPDQVVIPTANEAFSDNGAIIDARQREKVKALGTQLVQMLLKLHGH